MRKITILAATVLLSPLYGCAQPVERFGVDGVQGEFCPPSRMVPASVSWVPEDRANTPPGFTIRGCAKRPFDSEAQCAGLRQVLGADISSKGNANFFGWGDFKKSALAVRFVEDSRTRYEVHGRQLVIKNEHIWDQWLILSTSLKSDETTATRPHDDDTVMATCAHIDSFPLASRANTGRNFGCYRHALGPDYSLDYRFVTDSEIPDPEELAMMDRQLISRVDAWKCPGPAP